MGSTTAKAKRLEWFTAARFGMFVHWGIYSGIGRGEWARLQEGITDAEYHRVAADWRTVRPCPAREWAKLAKQAGMRYMVMTTKHHDGFCLWNTQQTDFNSVKIGPRRDLVREYVEACREQGLKVGLYYSLMDWDHPDGRRCVKSESARRSFLDFTQGCVRELLTNYGKIDILWYDVAQPLKSAKAWESRKLNAMARRLQPEILINNRAYTEEDFGTPEGEIKPAKKGRAWEACMTFNGDWGFVERPEEDWVRAREVVRMLRTCTAHCGNLLLNIGPTPDGSVPPLAVERLRAVGRWLGSHGEVMYGAVDPATPSLQGWNHVGQWTRKGNTAYLWLCGLYPGKSLRLNGIGTKIKRAVLVGDGRTLSVRQDGRVAVIGNLPASNPEKACGIPVIRIEFASAPRQNAFRGFM